MASEDKNPLARKLSKVLDTRLDSNKDMLDALKTLSGFFTKNTLKNRRSLRSDVEKRSLAIGENFASCFAEVKKELDGLKEDVEAMNECCALMTSRLKAAKDHTVDLLGQTTKLQAQSHELEMQAEVVEAFRKRFQLRAEEIAALRESHVGNLHKDFFSSLNRVKQIHTDCRVLLRSDQQRAGLEIMESMALYQEAAYETLYRWTQHTCHSLTSDSPDVVPALRHSMKAFKERQVLLKCSLDELATARRTAVVRMFIDALTRGGPMGTPRPIELHSHDPIRYIGDMLGWVHQAIASERELLQSILSHEQVDELPVKSALCHITEGVCQPLKVRVEQVIVSEQGAATLYKLANLLHFYWNMIRNMLGDENASLLVTIDELRQVGIKLFFNSLSCYAATLLDMVEVPPADLSPSSSVVNALSILKEIFQSHDASVVPMDKKKENFTRIVSSVIDPLIQACIMAASGLSAADMAVYIINCIYEMQNTLALYEFTDNRLEMLSAQCEAHLETLVHEQASYVLSKSGLGFPHMIIQEKKHSEQPLSKVEGMNGELLRGAMVKFDSFLSVPDSLMLPQCRQLLSTRLCDTAYRQAMEMVCGAYKGVFDAVHNPNNLYNDPSWVVSRTPEQVTALLL
ncbi:conserved oligomeric Golgi complex subunit 6-like [Corticium candelabrum]|uniref:conserved oligomeric Golgi complex subunit 6-like n=1 Tax=Corticium candelabrum TaxID=121492 RepID=UPI002E275EDD|nr:conserved oligomeric Golgi complex subunit 6-like [Corticium candelabrum]